MPRYRVTLVLVLLALGCPRPEEPGGGSRSPASPANTRTRALVVGNQAKGVADQPDYDREASMLRERVSERLPEALPGSEEACERMLTAVLAHYVALEGEQAEAVAWLRSTRTSDHAACQEETSPAAATCVTLLIEDREGEYPWLLDQCTRAFPKP